MTLGEHLILSFFYRFWKHHESNQRLICTFLLTTTSKFSYNITSFWYYAAETAPPNTLETQTFYWGVMPMWDFQTGTIIGLKTSHSCLKNITNEDIGFTQFQYILISYIKCYSCKPLKLFPTENSGKRTKKGTT